MSLPRFSASDLARIQPGASFGKGNGGISLRTRAGISKSARLAALFIAGCINRRIHPPVAEFKFTADRKWRFDLAWEFHRLALEIDGGAFIRGGGGHTRGAALRAEHEKRRRAAEDGWRIIPVFPEVVLSETTYDSVRQALRMRVVDAVEEVGGRG